MLLPNRKRIGYPRTSPKYTYTRRHTWLATWASISLAQLSRRFSRVCVTPALVTDAPGDPSQLSYTCDS